MVGNDPYPFRPEDEADLQETCAKCARLREVCARLRAAGLPAEAVEQQLEQTAGTAQRILREFYPGAGDG
jgi:hypothetical protein